MLGWAGQWAVSKFDLAVAVVSGLESGVVGLGCGYGGVAALGASQATSQCSASRAEASANSSMEL